MSQLAKLSKSKNLAGRHLTVQLGVSAAGPVALKVAARTNQFSASIGWATDPIEVQDAGPMASMRRLIDDVAYAEELLR
jgi:hypothetical protein